MEDRISRKNAKSKKINSERSINYLFKVYIPLILSFVVLVILCLLFFIPSGINTIWTDREKNLFQVFFGVVSVVFGAYFSRVLSDRENKTSAISAFRRILDIQKILKRQSQFLSRLSIQKKITNGDIGVLTEQNHSLADTVNTSKLDWIDQIGNVIETTDQIMTLQDEVVLYEDQGDSEKIKQLSTQIEDLKDRLPYVIQSRITERPSIPEVHIDPNFIKYYSSDGQKTSNISMQVQCSKPITYIQELLKPHPLIVIRFTLEAQRFWLKVFIQEKDIGTILSPFSNDTVSLNDFSYTLNSLLKNYLQVLDPHFLEAFEKKHDIELKNYEYVFQGTILKLTLPVDLKKHPNTFDI